MVPTAVSANEERESWDSCVSNAHQWIEKAFKVSIKGAVGGAAQRTFYSFMIRIYEGKKTQPLPQPLQPLEVILCVFKYIW